MIYITGDTHREQARFTGAQEKAWTADDIIIVCGDFGFLMDDDPFEHAFLDELEQRPYTICFIDGNHENFPAIFRHPEEVWNGGRIHRIRKNIIHLMRGQVFTIEGKRFFTMGGAYSIDRYTRQLNVSYWKEEQPSNEEYREADNNLNQYNRQVDYIITHTAPQKTILQMGHYLDTHDSQLTGFLQYLLESVTYKHWYFGHWHRDQKITPEITAVWFDVIAISEQDANTPPTTPPAEAILPNQSNDDYAINHPHSGTLLLTSFGLNTTFGANLIAKKLEGKDLSTKTIFLVSLASYGIDDLLQSACLRLGFAKENIFFSDANADAQTEPFYPECADYIYVTEGNTFKVLRHLRQKNLMPYIRNCVASGSTYIGASAGAILAGADVKFALAFDADRYNTTDFTALGLFDGTVIPHYSAEDLAQFIKNSSQEDLARYAHIYHLENDGLLQFG